MRPSRRQLIAGLAASPLVSAGCKDSAPVDSGEQAAPERAPEPARWSPSTPLGTEAFAYPLLVGDVTDSGALLSLKCAAEALEFVLMQAEGEGWVEVARAASTPVDGTAKAELTGLVEDTAYCVAAFGEGLRSEITRFRTALGAGGFRQLTFGATSCLGSSNPEWGSLARAAEEELDFMLLLGDTVYADGSQSLDDYRAHYDRALSTPAFRDMAMSTSILAIWDDHEVDNNWVLGETVTQERVDVAAEAFREAIPQRQGPEGQMWRSQRWGEVLEVFALDSRGERDMEAGRIVSEAQLAWIQQALLDSTARFKVVLASVHFTDHSGLFGTLEDDDRWQGYPEQRGPLRDVIAATPGAFLITGDFHYCGIQYIDPPGEPGEAVVEVAAGPAGSFLNPAGEIFEPGSNPQYIHLLAAWTYAWMRLDPALGTLQVRLIDDAGEAVAEESFQL
ncbi:MAG: alkaline phosphatase D family protein [Alphaproteobacteria bacterium]|nr:alkaline phosphatase D family protein [Alphaproteobacteria bacterium]